MNEELLELERDWWAGRLDNAEFHQRFHDLTQGTRHPRITHHVQTTGPRCKGCGGFTTYTRVKRCGLCMKCENLSKPR